MSIETQVNNNSLSLFVFVFGPLINTRFFQLTVSPHIEVNNVKVKKQRVLLLFTMSYSPSTKKHARKVKSNYSALIAFYDIHTITRNNLPYYKCPPMPTSTEHSIGSSSSSHEGNELARLLTYPASLHTILTHTCPDHNNESHKCR